MSVVHFRATWHTTWRPKLAPKQNLLYFRKWNFLTLRLKNFLYFLKKRLFLYFLKKISPQFPASALKNFRKNPALKKFYIFFKKIPNTHPPPLHFLEMEASKKSLYFRKHNFLPNNFQD